MAANDHPDTVLLDTQAEPVPEIVPEPPEREWYESPWLWAVLVVALLLSIPLLLELTGGSRKPARPQALTDSPPAASAPDASAAPAMPEPTVAQPQQPAVAPPPATPPSVIPRPPEPAKQMVIKCMEKSGRIVYTQTGACTGSMVPVPIDADKNVVDTGRPPAPSASPPRP